MAEPNTNAPQHLTNQLDVGSHSESFVVGSSAINLESVDSTGCSQASHMPPPQHGLNLKQPTNAFNAGTSSVAIPSGNIQQMLHLLRQHGYRETEEALMRESKYRTGGTAVSALGQEHRASERDGISQYKKDSALQPEHYFNSYESLVNFIDARALNTHRAELSSLLYPAFTHMYLELVVNRYQSEAIRFFQRFAKVQESYWTDDLKVLSTVVEPQHLSANDWFQHLKDNTFVIRLAREPFDSLMPFLNTHSLLGDILRKHVHIEIFDGAARDKDTADCYRGSFSGEALVKMNRAKIFHGLLRDSVGATLGDDGEEGAPAGGKSKKKSKTKDVGGAGKKQRADPNAPPVAKRIPLPEMSEQIKLERHQAAKEFGRRFRITPEKIPSVAIYTLSNAGDGGACCGDFTEDCLTMALGLDDSSIKVYSLAKTPFKPIKSMAELEAIDRESDDILEHMIDENASAESITFSGHSGPVYGVSFSPDKNQLLSASEDGSIRLWSMQLWTNLVAYRAGTLPIWDAEFGPYGQYFASGGCDKVAALWNIERPQPLRLFVGHFSDVNTVAFHPNGHYLGSGSADRCVRIWDVTAGQCVRVFSGAKGSVHSLAFSSDGQLLIGGDETGRLLIWDIAHGRLMANLQAHNDVIGALALSRDGSCLATGSTDCSIQLYHLASLLTELEQVGSEPISSGSAAANTVRTSTAGLHIAGFRTKNTPVVTLAFTRRNLLLGAGFYDS